MNRPSVSSDWRGRLKLLLLAAFFVAPIALAWLAYRFEWATGSAGNYGTLVSPTPVPDQALTGLDGRPLSGSLRGKWVLVQFDAPGCDADCERKLYYMRQVRRALGQNMERVARLWVLTEDGRPAVQLLDAVSGTVVARPGDARFAAAFGPPARRVEHIYLVDPMGNLMMRFPRDPDPSKMLKDLQRLLKYSQSG